MSEPTELDLLKQRADTLGLTYSPNIGVATLKKKISGALSGETPESDEVQEKAVSALQAKANMRKKAAELVRVIVVCNNPNKQAYEGEIIAGGNSLTGSIKKFIPFNNSEGWHVPQIILNVMHERMCQVFVNGKDSKGRSVKVSKLIKEFTITELPKLNSQEITKLATRQTIEKSIQA